MKNIKLRKAIYTSMLATLLFTGCGKTDKPVEEPITEATTVVQTTEEEIDVVYNDTLQQIIGEYKEKSGEDVKVSDFKVDTINGPQFVYKYTDENGNEKLEFKNYREIPEGHQSIDCSGKTLYIVKLNTHKDGQDWFVPVSGLLDGMAIENVEVNTWDDQGFEHSASPYYVYIDNPTRDNIDDLKNSKEYLTSKNIEPPITKEVNEVTLLYKNN